MNAILPDDLSHYAQRSSTVSAREVHAGSLNDQGQISDWDGPSGLEMEPGTEMSWVGPEPLR